MMSSVMSKNSFLGKSKDELISRFSIKKSTADNQTVVAKPRKKNLAKISETFYRFDRYPMYKKLMLPKLGGQRLGIANPFFKSHERVDGVISIIEGEEYINFSGYSYLGLSGHPQVNQAAQDAISVYGTSASASRIVAGERPVQRSLETALAESYEVDDCIVFVSGHATNMNTIGYLFGPKDLVLHDSLAHNSILEGIKLSGATRRSFPHNDAEALDDILTDIRANFERVLVVIEGLYSMDGDIPDLPKFVEVKNRHKTFLMVDEAHSLGVLGETGKGLREHFGLPGNAVDIWMGTLSKTLAGCGGYVAGETALVEHLKYAAPGFVYSVGLAPPLAAASLQALKIMQQEPERVSQLRQNAQQFISLAKARGINTGLSQGWAVIPFLVGSSIKAIKLSNQFFEHGINVQPIIYPAVEEKAARLRFFISSQHTQQQINQVFEAVDDMGGI
jgi:8-amino-7-oxononanoate synthase